MTDTPHGVAFPAGQDGDRSTTATGRAVVADALRPVDPLGARASEQETAWRSRYLLHFRRLVEAGLDRREDWLAIAEAGLDSANRRMCVVSDGQEAPVTSLLDAPAGRTLGTVEVKGSGDPE